MSNLLQLSQSIKTMPFINKIKLLVANEIKEMETKGEEHILTSHEKTTILNNARNKNEMNSIARVMTLLRYSQLSTIYFHTSLLLLQIYIQKLEEFLLLSLVEDRFNDSFRLFLYNTLSKDYSQKKLEDQKIQKIINQKAQQIFDQHIKESCLKENYSILLSVRGEIDYFSIEKKEEFYPHPVLVETYTDIINQFKKVNGCIYKIECCSGKAGVDLLTSEQKRFISLANDLIQSYEKFDGILIRLRIFYTPYKINIVARNDVEKEFLSQINNFKTEIQISPDGKDAIEAEVECFVRENI